MMRHVESDFETGYQGGFGSNWSSNYLLRCLYPYKVNPNLAKSSLVLIYR